MDIEAGERFEDARASEFYATSNNNFQPSAAGSPVESSFSSPERPRKRRRTGMMEMEMKKLVHIAPTARIRDDRSRILLEMAFKVGIWATGLSIPGFVSVLMGPFSSQAASMTTIGKVVSLACLLAMLASSVSGGALLILAVFWRDRPPLRLSNIRFIIAVAIASVAILIFTGFALKLSII